MDGIQHVVDSDDVEVGVLLTGEACAGKILRGGRRSYGDRCVGARLQATVSRSHGVGDRRRERGVEHGCAGGRCIRRRSRLDRRPPDRAPVSLSGDAEAGRHVEAGADQLSEIRGLSADRRDTVGRDLSEIDDEGIVTLDGASPTRCDHRPSFASIIPQLWN
jgi:hypothetical protein